MLDRINKKNNVQSVNVIKEELADDEKKIGDGECENKDNAN